MSASSKKVSGTFVLDIFAGTAAGAEGRLQAEAFGGALHPGVAAERATAAETLSQGLQFGFGLGLLDPVQPIPRATYRPF